MRAMILAAGLGTRMQALTANCPKPLLRVAGHYLIEYAIDHLKRAGISDIVINIAYHGSRVKEVLQNGQAYGVHLAYSEEELPALETGGGIVKALPLLGSLPFIVISGDIVTDFPLATLPSRPEGLAHLVLVANPSFHPTGDFGLRAGKVNLEVHPRLTFANIGVYDPDLFAGYSPERFPLNQLLFPAIKKEQVTGEYYAGKWFNVGTPAELQRVETIARMDSTLRPLTI